MKTVLIVDDSIFMRVSLKNILTRHGFNVIAEAKNGRIGLEKFKELSPDIVTMDITMEEMTGLEALRAIVDYDKQAKVVMVSAMGQKPYVQEALQAGAKGFLVKPYDEEVVVSTLSKLH